jgi:UDP-N-acetylglucosamine--N-acetylmuramyl-(pentapeptide) pyrophosphoryl-undecaprenol N-acetylglucosamine transferase
LLAVANDIKKIDKSASIVFIGQKGDPFGKRLESSDIIDQATYISAGKFRRYHGSGLAQLLDLVTIYKNIIDFFKFIIGTIQAYTELRKIKPDIIFIKGGYIGVPVGLAAAFLHIKYITHDSDTMPGLANRIISKWALSHATGMPKELYNYPKNKTEYVGVPISDNYYEVSSSQQTEFKKQLGLNDNKKVILVAGGGLGSLTLNRVLLDIINPLLEDNPDTIIYNIAGKDHEESYNKEYDKLLDKEDRERVIIKGFVTDMYIYSGAADLVISRAGATNLAEFATQAKACLIIPSPYLAGGHQLKNAIALKESGAVDVIDEKLIIKEPRKLLIRINELMRDSDKRQNLGKKFHEFAKKDSAYLLAKLIMEKAQ